MIIMVRGCRQVLGLLCHSMLLCLLPAAERRDVACRRCPLRARVDAGFWMLEAVLESSWFFNFKNVGMRCSQFRCLFQLQPSCALITLNIRVGPRVSIIDTDSLSTNGKRREALALCLCEVLSFWYRFGPSPWCFGPLWMRGVLWGCCGLLWAAASASCDRSTAGSGPGRWLCRVPATACHCLPPALCWSCAGAAGRSFRLLPSIQDGSGADLVLWRRGLHFCGAPVQNHGISVLGIAQTQIRHGRIKRDLGATTTSPITTRSQPNSRVGLDRRRRASRLSSDTENELNGALPRSFICSVSFCPVQLLFFGRPSSMSNSPCSRLAYRMPPPTWG